ncbi:hypothetical protein SAMN05192568_10784 [Methylobacterium pseudosasicola]|uniref:Uncharacterized protein n=1 Tax=Methylobacterium pseudosasicola TaxID=582667 RepID=A0A1I4UUZ3_9HYPH|nr:hypothetical protein SAMN05192568_10784 [Methylobacterium pseudosasicola]
MSSDRGPMIYRRGGGGHALNGQNQSCEGTDRGIYLGYARSGT